MFKKMWYWIINEEPESELVKKLKYIDEMLDQPQPIDNSLLDKNTLLYINTKYQDIFDTCLYLKNLSYYPNRKKSKRFEHRDSNKKWIAEISMYTGMPVQYYYEIKIWTLISNKLIFWSKKTSGESTDGVFIFQEQDLIKCDFLKYVDHVKNIIEKEKSDKLEKRQNKLEKQISVLPQPKIKAKSKNKKV